MTDEEKEKREYESQRKAQELDDLLRPIAKKLGLRMLVTHDADAYEYCIDVSLTPPPRHTATISEEIFLRDGKHVTELLARTLEDLQLKTHDSFRDAMAETDARGRFAKLSREQKNALHELIWLAVKGLNPIYPDCERDRKKLDDARTLLDGLFR